MIIIFILPLINSISQTADLRNQKFKRHYYIKKDVFESMPNSKKEILFVGNSITAGGEWSELFNNPNVKNRGISGDVTEGVLFRLEEITESKPSKIFLMIGVNDLSKGISTDSILTNYETIITRILNATPSTKIFIQSILPVNDEYDYFKDHINKGNSILIINEKLRRLSEKYNQKYIDLFSSFANAEGKLKHQFTFDGLHLNGNGYTAWKNLIADYVE
jgi:lysophospholipase L1-like esterase